MKIVELDFPTPLSKSPDIFNDNVDVFVKLDDGRSYTFVVSTPQNLYWYMDKEGIDYVPAAQPMIFVRFLTEQNIRETLETFLEGDGYWFKFYYAAGYIKPHLLDETINEMKKDWLNED